jgi:hypothetical protein
MSDERLLAVHEIAYQQDINDKYLARKILRRGFLLPKAYRVDKSHGLYPIDYLAGDSVFVFNRVIKDSSTEPSRYLYDPRFFPLGYFVFDAFELVDLGAVVRSQDNIEQYHECAGHVLDEISQETGLSSRALIDYILVRRGAEAESNIDIWVGKSKRNYASWYRSQSHGYIDNIIRRVAECLDDVCMKTDKTGQDAMDELNAAWLQGSLSNLEILWEGPMPITLALPDSSIFALVRG